MNRQKGMTTIIVAVIILVIISLMVLYAARVGLFDQRMSANQARYKEAFAIAEAGLDMAAETYESLYRDSTDVTDPTTLATILANSQISTNTNFSGNPATANEPYFTATVTASGAINTVQATGVGSDGTGTATIQRQFTLVNGFGGTTPDVPVIVGGSVGSGGNFNIVANPNGGGAGVPVSVWTGSSAPAFASANIEATGSSATCHFEFYEGGNAQCANPSGSGHDENISDGDGTTLVNYDPNFPDLLPNDPDFPSDLFNFLFAINRADWSTMRSQIANNSNGQQVVTNCNNVAALGASAGEAYPFWWIEGDCDIGGNVTIGSEDNPVVLIISDSQLKVTGGATIFGITYLFDNPGTGGSPSAALNGTTELIGSFVSEAGGAAMSGSYSVVYNPNIFDSFINNGSSYSFAWVPGSWRDY